MTSSSVLCIRCRGGPRKLYLSCDGRSSQRADLLQVLGWPPQRFALPQDTYGAFDPAIGTQATDNGPAIH
jgi:hypothetical protein